MCDGKLRVDGTFAECVASSSGLIDFVSQNAGCGVKTEKKDDEGLAQDKSANVYHDSQTNKVGVKSTETRNGINDQNETKEIGSVSRATFTRYAKSIGGFWVAMRLFALFILSQAASLAAIAMIGRWSERTPEKQVSTLAFVYHPY